MKDACLIKTILQPMRHVCLNMEPSTEGECASLQCWYLGKQGGGEDTKPQVLASGRGRELGDGEEVGTKLAAPASVPGWPGPSPYCPGTEGSAAAPHLSC